MTSFAGEGPARMGDIEHLDYEIDGGKTRCQLIIFHMSGDEGKIQVISHHKKGRLGLFEHLETNIRVIDGKNAGKTRSYLDLDKAIAESKPKEGESKEAKSKR